MTAFVPRETARANESERNEQLHHAFLDDSLPSPKSSKQTTKQQRNSCFMSPENKGHNSEQHLLIKSGDGPYQALQREFTSCKPAALKNEAHRLKKAAGHQTFNKGDEFTLHSDGSIVFHRQAKQHNPSKNEGTATKAPGSQEQINNHQSHHPQKTDHADKEGGKRHKRPASSPTHTEGTPPQKTDGKSEHTVTPNNTGENAPERSSLVDDKFQQAIMKNEEAKFRSGLSLRNLKEPIEDFGAKYLTPVINPLLRGTGLPQINLDVGPAKMSQLQMEELKADSRYREQLKDADPLTHEGAAKFIGAYLRREQSRFNSHDYSQENQAAFDKDRPFDAQRPKIRAAFNRLQQLWDRAVAKKDAETMRQVLISTYNPGLGSTEVREVYHQLGLEPDLSAWKVQ